MADEVQKTFIRSFVLYLKKQMESQALTPDAKESVEVAVQCLNAAFDIEDEEEQSSAATPSVATGTEALNAKEIDIFELFQSMYIERNPESLQMAEKIKNEGNRLMKDGKYNEALLQYNRAITFDPKNPIFYCNRAAAYIRLGDNERAVTDCKSALVYNANYGKAYGRLGIAYSNLGKYDEAQQAYAKAIELEPDNQDYRNNLEVARNSRSQGQMNPIPQLTEGISAMLSSPAIRQLFGSADIDLENLQNLSQNPMFMNAMGQILNNLQPGAMFPPGVNPGGAGGVPPMPNDVLQLFQSFATQLASGTNPANNRSGGDGNNSNSNEQPPPPPPPSAS